ncbi:hypothetical protein CRM22_004685 [Opisthorchis felineus]|uniref:PH domain-containing protein n=1 Tax=Opisthorchis felineus TaxID=147828 RepID=A0A4S2LVV7_OPIFE|nr:hypothetical protein CRM22_004685 [Opisthorchis felineus]
MASSLKEGNLKLWVEKKNRWKDVYCKLQSSGWFHWYEMAASKHPIHGVDLRVVRAFFVYGSLLNRLPRLPTGLQTEAFQRVFAVPHEPHVQTKISFFLCQDDAEMSAWMSGIFFLFNEPTPIPSPSEGVMPGVPSAPNYDHAVQNPGYPPPPYQPSSPPHPYQPSSPPPPYQSAPSYVPHNMLAGPQTPNPMPYTMAQSAQVPYQVQHYATTFGPYPMQYPSPTTAVMAPMPFVGQQPMYIYPSPLIQARQESSRPEPQERIVMVPSQPADRGGGLLGSAAIGVASGMAGSLLGRALFGGWGGYGWGGGWGHGYHAPTQIFNETTIYDNDTYYGATDGYDNFVADEADFMDYD